MSEVQQSTEYVTSDLGLAAFLVFVLSEDYFLGAAKRPDNTKRSQFFFSDTCLGNTCAELAGLYHSGAQLTNAKEFSACHKLAANATREASRGKPGIRYRGF